VNEASAPSLTTEKQLKPWHFRPRWRIEGCLFTCTSLHIGSGQVVFHPDLEQEGRLVKISAHVTDHTGRASLPGSALKGGMRAWAMERRSQDPSHLRLCETLFGKGSDKNSKKDLSQGGLAEFHDLRLSVTRTEPTPLPHWNERRQTWIEASNSIDRHTRTAADQHLIHTECVPAGVGFDLTISGWAEPDDNSADQLLTFLLTILEGFNDTEDPILLGADTASGKGRVGWRLGQVFKMTKEDVATWVKNRNRQMAELELPSVDIHRLNSPFKDKVIFTSPKDLLTIPITLNFDSHFLVNDPPGQRELDESGSDSSGSDRGDQADNGPKVPNHRPRKDEMGNVILPAKSFKGALRSQAERILRTLGYPACDPSNSEKTCVKPVETTEDLENVCLACKLFGAPGWKSPLEISDFRLVPGDYKYETQEFVAVDRFTGGSKDGAKFNARVIYQPDFSGDLKLNQTRLTAKELGLLALTLRDLKEGDITFGLGAAKGFGTCRAEIPVFGNQALDEDDQTMRDKMIEGVNRLRFYTSKKKGEDE
jgi:CRISPR/Cas system CSM-associated protein Csm3 (group 7 of RAMP superfamily)